MTAHEKALAGNPCVSAQSDEGNHSTTHQNEEGAFTMIPQNTNKDDLIAEGRALFDKYVLPERQRRKENLGAWMGFVLDALAAPGTDTDHEFLKVAYPLNADRDKALGYWTAHDLMNAAIERHQDPTVDTADAKYFQKRAGFFISEMVRLNAETINQMFERKSAGDEYGQHDKSERAAERDMYLEHEYRSKRSRQFRRDNDAILDAAEYREDL